LLFVESGAVTKRLQELYNNPIKIKGIENLFDIHKHLFQDIYIWAGKKRVVEISKVTSPWKTAGGSEKIESLVSLRS
jgi:cell filamentation protein